MEGKRKHYADEELQAMLHCLKKDDPNITCPCSKKRVTKICINPKCKIALRCSDAKCKICGREAHMACLSMPLEQITELINERSETCREMLAGVFRIQEEFIEEIRKKRKQFMDQYMMGKVKEQGSICIKRIYIDKKFDALTGKQAQQMCVQLQPVEGQMIGRSENLEIYAKKMKQQLENITKLRDSLFTTEIIDKKLNVFRINSRVLELKGNEMGDLNFIRRALNYPTEFQLIFRASEHGFKASEFHRLCDNIEDTFILLRTQFNKTIGGYSHYIWDKMADDGDQVNDAGRRAFLLQVDLHEKLTPIKQDQLIVYDSDFGPIFGGGHDLFIKDRCHINNSGCYIGNTYNHEGTNKYTINSQATHTAICGNPNNFTFKVIEYEVFRVLWK